jgi:hypothetical protein
MATTTPNYGWPVPTSTDYVKDGATAIEALGDAIDATVFGLGSGLVKIATASFSAASAVSLAGNTFTSTYSNYKIIANFINSASNEIRCRFRSAGTDNTTNDSYTADVGVNSGNAAANLVGSPQTYGIITTGISTYASSFDLTIYNPLSSNDKMITGSSVDARAMIGRNVGVAKWTSTTFDSFSFYPSTGTITGSYTIYGMQK